MLLYTPGVQYFMGQPKPKFCSAVVKNLDVARTAPIPPKFYLDKYEETASVRTEVKKLRNKALAELLNGSVESVNGTIDGSDDKDSAQGAYLKAVAAARQDNLQGVVGSLTSAISKDASFKEGEEIEVKVLGIDRGRIKLSRKVLIEK